MRLPDFVLIGLMKCGSSTLAQLLGDHSDVWLWPGKEVRYFDRHYLNALDWYSGLFDGRHERLVGEATPSYLYERIVLDRMASDLPQSTKFLVILRDPVKRLVSHYRHNLTRGREDGSLEDALALEGERVASLGLDQRGLFAYAGMSMYAEQIRSAVELLGSTRVHVLLLEDLVANPNKQMALVQDFLGLRQERLLSADVAPVANAYVEFRSLRVRTLAQRISGPIGKGIGRANARKVDYAGVDRVTVRRLQSLFDEDVRQLEHVLDRDLREVWGFA